MATALQSRKILIDASCGDWRNEALSYVWDDRATEDRPIKENDHCMDDTRYLVNTIIARGDVFRFS